MVTTTGQNAMNLTFATLACAATLALPTACALAAPSFDCTKVQAGSVADLVCRDPELSRLDRQLAQVFAHGR